MILRYAATLLLLVGLLAPQEADAQGRFPQRRTSRGFHDYVAGGVLLGSASYTGDLDDDFFPKFAKWGVGAHLSYHFHPHLYVQASYLTGEIGATDEASNDFARNWRNLHFRSKLNEFALTLHYEIIGTKRHWRLRPFFTPYIYAGVGIFTFNPQARPDSSWVFAYPEVFGGNADYVDLQPLRTEGQGLNVPGYPERPYALTQMSVPIGFGGRFAVAPNINIAGEIGLRKTFTDYLDDVSNIYAPPQVLADYDLRSFLFADRSGYVNFGQPFVHPVTGEYVRVRSPEEGYPGYTSAYNVMVADNEIRGDVTDDDWYIFTSIKITFILDRNDRCPKF